jgi:NCS1 family nucleobase:cation symporter-1
MSAVTTPVPETDPEIERSPSEPLGIERHSIDVIPERERHGSIHQQGVFWFLSNTQTLSVALGFTGVALGLSLWISILALVLGNALGTVFMALHASQGPRLGLPQLIQSRAQFGYRGVVLPVAVGLFTQLVYGVIDTVILGQGLKGVWSIAPGVTAFVISLVGIWLGVWGYDWLHRAFRVLFWASLPLWLILTVGIITGGAGGHAAAHSSFKWSYFFIVFATGASNNISYAPVVSDYSRYLPRRTPPRLVFAWVYAGAFLSLSWLGAIGAWLAAELGATDALVSVRAAGNHIVNGFGTLLLIVAVLALVATIGEIVYSTALQTLTAFDSFKPTRPTVRSRATIAIVFTLIYALLGTLVFKSENTTIDDGYLLSLYVLTPWTIINLYDYFFVRKGRYAITELDKPHGIYGNWAWRGFAAYAVGLAASVPFWDLSFYTGPFPKANDGLDISFIVGLVVSGIVYAILSRSIKVHADDAAVKASEDELVKAGILESALA